MCGNLGFKALNRPPDDWYRRLTAAFLMSEKRGDDATGIYMFDGRKEVLLKSPLAASDFIRTREYRRLQSFKPLVCIAHVRAATQGTPSDNGNNHPISLGDFVLAHNGIISNDKELRNLYELPDKPEVDSYVIVGAVKKLVDRRISVEAAVDMVQRKLNGSYVCLLYDRAKKNLHIFRNNDQLYLGAERGATWWASEEDTLLWGARFCLWGRIIEPEKQPNANGKKLYRNYSGNYSHSHTPYSRSCGY